MYGLANSYYVPFSTMQLRDPDPRVPHCACSHVQVGSMHVYMHVHPWQVTRMVMPSKPHAADVTLYPNNLVAYFPSFFTDMIMNNTAYRHMHTCAYVHIYA